MSDQYTGVMYLTVRNDTYTPRTSEKRLKPVKVTGKYPSVVDADEVVVRLRVVIPERAFAALVPEADVTVDPTQLYMPVEVSQA